MRWIFSIVLLLGASLAQGETLTIAPPTAKAQTAFHLKRILAKVSDRIFRGLIVGLDGGEQQIYLTADDVFEVKRGLWELRPGTYQTAI